MWDGFGRTLGALHSEVFFNPIPLAAGSAAEEGQIKFSRKLLSSYLRKFKQSYLKNNNNKKGFFNKKKKLPPPDSLEHNLGCNSEVESNSINTRLGINSHASIFVMLVQWWRWEDQGGSIRKAGRTHVDVVVFSKC